MRRPIPADVVLARGMNTLAFTNHLLCDVFAVTAFLREARDQNSASYAPQILAAWSKVAPVFSSSGFPKFTALGSAIQQKVPLEQQMVDTYSAWAKSVSDQVLPMMEEILSQELIPKYQRAVVVAFPEIAQSAARETASAERRPRCHRRGPMFGVLWRTDAQPVGGDAESSYSPDDRTLPVVDPELDSLANQDQYVQTAVAQRRTLSHTYLDQWNAELLSGFDQLAKMSQFGGLWRSFTCGYLEHLLNVEYPKTNLPMVIYENPAQTANSNATLAETLHVYQRGLLEEAAGDSCRGCSRIPWRPTTRRLPRSICSFRASAWNGSRKAVRAAVRVRRRWAACPARLPMCPSSQPAGSGGSGGGGGATTWVVGRVGGPTVWNLLNQSWNCQLAPSRSPPWPRSCNPIPICPALVPDSTSCRTWAGSAATICNRSAHTREKHQIQNPKSQTRSKMKIRNPKIGWCQGFGPESRLSLRESSATFAERKATLADRERL